MTDVDSLIARAKVHQEWQPILRQSLATLENDYVDSLLAEDSWLPGIDNLLAAFRRDRNGLRDLLIGESPYPRRESANGVAFYDAAVDSLWSEQGLSKAVNRATSLRNIVKTALLAEGLLQRDNAGKITQDAIARLDKHDLIRSLGDFFSNLERSGFLMLNATPVLHPERKPAQEAKYWLPFLDRLLTLIVQNSSTRITLVLWGKIAKLIETIPASRSYDQIVCEHPYNISFIDNPKMLQLFAQLRILQRVQ
jgi:uracil-DNA glycosylase